MTTLPPPGQPPSGSWPPPDPTRAPTGKPRPSGWWFLLPVVLLVGAAVTFGVLLWGTVSATMETDAEIPVDGQTHRVTVPTDESRTVFVDQHATNPVCRFVDAGTGRELPVSPYRGSFTRSTNAGEWRAAWDLDPGGGTLDVTCTADGAVAPVQIAPPIDAARFAGGLAATVLVPLALGALGVLALILLIVLFVTRRPRTS